MASLAVTLLRAIQQAVPAVENVEIGTKADKATWRVLPTNLQSVAQPVIDAFDVNDPIHAQADADAMAETLARSPLATAFLELMAETFETLPKETVGRILLDPVNPRIGRDVSPIDALRLKLTDRLRIHTAKQE